jgi:hypothetical protein
LSAAPRADLLNQALWVTLRFQQDPSLTEVKGAE